MYQSGLQRRLLNLRTLVMEAGWGCLVVKLSIKVCKCCSGGVAFCDALWCIRSFLICCSIATIPSFFLLTILVFATCFAHLAWVPLADFSSWAVRAAFTANVQYFWVSIWNFESSVKLILRRKWLTSGTSLGAKLDRDSISRMISYALFVCR